MATFQVAISTSDNQIATGPDYSIGSGSVRGQVKIEGLTFDGVEMYVEYHRIQPKTGIHSWRLDNYGRFEIGNLSPGEYEFEIGPAGMHVGNEGQLKIQQRIPTVKQIVKVTAAAESEVIMTTKLNPVK
jgi:hypothetical protein